MTIVSDECIPLRHVGNITISLPLLVIGICSSCYCQYYWSERDKQTRARLSFCMTVVFVLTYIALVISGSLFLFKSESLGFSVARNHTCVVAFAPLATITLSYLIAVVFIVSLIGFVSYVIFFNTNN